MEWKSIVEHGSVVVVTVYNKITERCQINILHRKVTQLDMLSLNRSVSERSRIL